MRIGFDAKRFFHNSTGLGNYSRDLIRVLSLYYPKNTYFLFNPKKSSNLIKLTSKINITEVLPQHSFWFFFSFFWRSFGLNKQIYDNKIEIFHGLSGEIPIFLNSKVKKIVTIHDLIFIRYPKLYSFWDRKIHTLKFKYAAKKSDIIIAISEQTKKDIIKYFSIDPEKIEVIYQGCSNVFKNNFSEEHKNNVKKKFNLPNNFILNVGTIEERKNSLSIVKSIKNIDTKLVLIGKKTSYYEQIEKYAKENNIENKLIYLKNVSLEELAIIYQLADIFIYPSIFEGFGIPIIEALYSKTPVITNKNGVFPEAGGQNSIYIDPLNVNEIAEAIQFLLDNPLKREQITEKGYEFVQKFSDESIANNINNLYTKLLN